MSYYIKLNGLYLQSDDRDEPFFDEDIVGTPYTTTNKETAKELLSITCPIIPLKLFTFEQAPTTKYHRAMMLMHTILVWGTDDTWHNIDDVNANQIRVYESAETAVRSPYTALNIYARVIL